MRDALPATDPLQNFCDFVFSLGEKRNVLANHLFGRVAVHPLRTPVPGCDGSVEVLADDGVFRGIDNRGQPRAVSADLLGRPALQFRVRAPQFFFNPLAVTNVSDCAEHQRAASDRDRAQADFHVELGAVSSPAFQLQARTHTARPGGTCKRSAMLPVASAKSCGYKDLYRLTDQLAMAIAE